MFLEGANLEYKREWTEGIIPEIVSFLNTSGGTLYIGVSDNGEIYGVSDPDSMMVKIANKIRDCIAPSAVLLVFTEILHDRPTNKNVIMCRVEKGNNGPYYVKQEGLIKGVYIRIGSSRIHADETTVRELIRNSDPLAFESSPSPNQQLSFAYATAYFEKVGIEFTRTQQKTLGIVTASEVYSNLGLWLSDQCPHIIKAAAFNGTDMTEFKQRSEMTGSILMQFDSAIQFIANNNSERMYIDPATFQRLEFRKFPDVAARETVLNALMHRDYSLPHATQLKIFSDRLELVSFGSLMPELSAEDVGSGISVCRNNKLANIFYRLHLAEAFGTGIPKIYKAYSKYNVKPQFEALTSVFKVILPGMDPPADSTNFFALAD